MRLTLIITALFSLNLLAQEPTPPMIAEQANELLTTAIQEGKFVGVTAGFAVGENIIWAGSAGTCNEDRDTPCEQETINRTASITKTMTAVAALQLVEKGQLDLDATIDTYLPNYPKTAASKITTRMLLQHTSGIGGYANGKEAETQEEYPTLQAACALFQDRELLFEPGTRYQYTTYGYVVLGAIIEVVAEQNFTQYLQENIWDVVDMPNTGVERFGADYANKSALFTRTRKGKLKVAEANNLSNRIPGGGVFSTVPDILKFGQALLNGKLLSEESLLLMYTAPDVERGSNNPYGMGLWHYGDNPTFGPVIGHTGGQTGASGHLFLMPETKVVVIVMANTSRALQDASQLAVNLFPLAASVLPEQ
ncbi:MAG: serine hydrolase domain-containing protein [Bacteroidota bacterium]